MVLSRGAAVVKTFFFFFLDLNITNELVAAESAAKHQHVQIDFISFYARAQTRKKWCFVLQIPFFAIQQSLGPFRVHCVSVVVSHPPSPVPSLSWTDCSASAASIHQSTGREASALKLHSSGLQSLQEESGCDGADVCRVGGWGKVLLRRLGQV